MYAFITRASFRAGINGQGAQNVAQAAESRAEDGRALKHQPGTDQENQGKQGQSRGLTLR